MIAIFAASVAYATLFLALATAAARMMRRSTAASRHLVWSTAIAASILAPFLLLLGSVGAFRAIGIVRALIDVSWPFVLPPVGFRARAIILNLWFAGSVAALLRVLAGSAGIRWRALRSERIDDMQWRELAGAAAASLGVRRPVSLRAGAGDVPFTIGVLRPAICLPDVASDWPADRAQLVLLHELAHVMRYDAATRCLERFAIVLFWFHPLMRLAVKSARRERERACDDLVVARSGRPVPYAATLLALAAEDGPRKPENLAFGSFEIESRIAAILDPSIPRRPSRVHDAAGAFLVACALAFTAILFGAGPAHRLGSACEVGSEPSLVAFRRAGAYQRIHRLYGCTEVVAFGGAELDPKGRIGPLPPHGRVLIQTVTPERTSRVEIVPGRTTCRRDRRPVPAAECKAIVDDAMCALRRHHELQSR